jgi:hypothetical protein
MLVTRAGISRLVGWGVFACVALIVADPLPAHAGATRCRGVIVKAARQFILKEASALQSCWQRVADGKRSGPCPDVKTAETITDLQGKLAKVIAKACGGEDEACGEGTPVRDESLAPVGWNVGSCAHFGNAACTNAIADCNDITACVQCLAEEAIEQGFDLFFDPQAVDPSTTGGNKTLVKCLQAIGRGGSKQLGRAASELGSCWATVNKKDTGGSFSCPSAKNVVRIAKAKTELSKKICRECGGADRSCGGGDDITLASIGFPASCPAVGTCGGPVGDLDDVADCIDCVIRSVTDAVARSTNPAYSATLPPQCIPGPTPTP